MKYLLIALLNITLCASVCWAGDTPQLHDEKDKINYSDGHQVGNAHTHPRDEKGKIDHSDGYQIGRDRQHQGFDGGPLAGVVTSFSLATPNFTGVGKGTSILDLTGEVNPFLSGAAPTIDPVISYAVNDQGSMTFAPVPEPASMLLLATGMVGLIVLRRESSPTKA